MTETTATEPASTETQPERPREKNPDKIRPALEALLFSSARPVSEKDHVGGQEAGRRTTVLLPHDIGVPRAFWSEGSRGASPAGGDRRGSGGDGGRICAAAGRHRGAGR